MELTDSALLMFGMLPEVDTGADVVADLANRLGKDGAGESGGGPMLISKGGRCAVKEMKYTGYKMHSAEVKS